MNNPVTRKDIEIMAPAGSYESLHAAINAGADSVYFGVGKLNMRSRSAANFTLDDLREIVRICTGAGVKAYLTVNTVLYDDELDDMRQLIDTAHETGVSAVICADQAAIVYAREAGMEVHISTQANISNTQTLKFYSQWADVVVLARELTLEQITRVCRAIEEERITGPSGQLVRVEMFAHGAMCMAISGRCYLSEHNCGHSANRGACRQLCRRSYMLTDRDTGEQIEVDGQYLLSPKDLCTITFLDRFIEAGVRVLKIEGRARSAEYVKRVVESYDEAIKAYVAGEFTAEKAQVWEERLATVFNRGFWGGYYAGAPVVELSANYGSSATMRKVYVGKVTNFFKRIGVAEVYVEASAFEKGAEYVVTGNKTGAVEGFAEEIYVEEKPVAAALQGVYCSFATSGEVRRGDRLYKMVPASEVDLQ